MNIAIVIPEKNKFSKFCNTYMDYFLFNFFKVQVYSNKPETIDNAKMSLEF